MSAAASLVGGVIVFFVGYAIGFWSRQSEIEAERTRCYLWKRRAVNAEGRIGNALL